MTENKTVTQQLAQLETLSKASAIRKFVELFGFEPQQTKNVPALRARLAFRIQELYYGGLSETARAKLDEYADKDPMANLCRTPKSKRSAVLGKRYVREWDGVRHKVILLADGRAEYKGCFFRSLTAVAEHITGMHQSGYAFFRINRGAKHEQ